MKRELSSQRFIELGNWGVLFMNEEGNICFKTQNSSPFIRPDLFGLKELQMARLDELMASEELSLKGKKRPFRRVLQSAAASAAAALLIFAASVPIYDKQEQSAQYAGFFAGKIASTNEIPAPSIKTSSEVSRNATSAEKDIEKPVHECETPSPQLQPEAIAQKRYYIIVSTFRTTAIAEKELNNFRAKGFSTSGIIEEPRAKRIYVASFAEESGASDFLKKFIENNPNNADAWIYTKKPIAK